MDVKRPGTAFVLALVGVFVAPILVIFELSALFLAGMIVAEPTNALIVKILAVTLVVLIAVVAVAIPLIALILGSRARAAARATQGSSTGLATAAMVIAAIVTAGVLVAQIYYILMVVGSCSLEGC